MSDAKRLDGLIDACMAALGDNGDAGRDLAAANIATDDAARKWHDIKEAFHDSKEVDWDAIHNDGLAILRDESRDLFALWAVLAPLPVVRGHGFEGVSASLVVCNRFLGDSWESMFPVLPEGLNLRASILSQLVRRWTGFVKQATATEADGSAIQALAERLDEFETRVYDRMPSKIAPQTGQLRQLIQAFRSRFAPVEEPAAAEGDAETGEAETDPASAAVAEPGSELESAYANAVRLLGSRPEQALKQLGALVERQATRAGKFRGQVYLGELYLRAGHTQLARQMLTFLDQERGTIKLEDWEPELCGKLWSSLYQAMVAEQGGSDPPKEVKARLDELFACVCRVDPKQAIVLKGS